MSTLPLEPFMLAVPGHGRRFALLHAPAAGVLLRGVVLHVPAFGEEMNKSRRMVALAARALAGAGFAVMQLDLFGCGDSDGEFEQATWAQWRQDLLIALDWLDTRFPRPPVWLWSHRAGSLLAADVAGSLSRSVHHLLWQPVLQGGQVMRTLLRTKAAASWASSDSRAVLEQARSDLAAGRNVEIAGYLLSSTLAEAMQKAVFAAPRAVHTGAQLVWLEASPPSRVSLAPAAANQAEQWRRAGASVVTQCVPGPAFWQSVDIEYAPELVTATVDQLTRLVDQAMPTGVEG